MKKIEVVKKEIKFKALPCLAIQDENLSYSARGLYAFVMSKPNNWRGQIYHLSDSSKQDSTYLVRKALKELVQSGYAALRKVKKDNGFYGGSYYEFFNEKTFEF
jgi:hypothetical protein